MNPREQWGELPEAFGHGRVLGVPRQIWGDKVVPIPPAKLHKARRRQFSVWWVHRGLARWRKGARTE